MNPKMQEYFTKRLPIVLRMRDGVVYYQLQIDVARDDGLCAGTYLEYKKTEKSSNVLEIGSIVLKLLLRFHEIADLSISDFKALTGYDNPELFEKKQESSLFQFFNAVDSDDLDRNYLTCLLSYTLSDKKYHFALSWFYNKGNNFYYDSSDSTGKPSILTFEKPLEFDDSISPEELGKMVLEAFDRSEKMAEKMSGTYCPPKTIDLYNGSFLEVTPPLDKHFADYEDYGVGEIYQVYSYLKKEGDKPSANFMLTIAPEIRNDLSTENIKKAWAEVYGASEDMSAEEKNYGIFRYRAELQNSDIFRISYFKELDDDSIIECCMEVKEPLKKQKLIEKLIPMFEKFALKCKIK